MRPRGKEDVEAQYAGSENTYFGAAQDEVAERLKRFAGSTVKPVVAASGGADDGCGSDQSPLSLPRVDSVETSPARSQASPPPLFWETLLQFLARGDQEYILGDLTERYEKKQAVYGTKYARNWYRSQVLISIGPLLWKVIKTLIWVLLTLRKFI